VIARDVTIIAFDVFGTLFDIDSLGTLIAVDGPNFDRLIQTWRQKQLEYSFIRTMTGCYADFTTITSDALSFAAAHHGIQLSEQHRVELVNKWQELRPYPEVPSVLGGLQNWPLAVLSNGTSPSIERLVSAAGIHEHFSAILSADRVKRFKPDPAVYRLVLDEFGVSPSNVLFVTANGFDMAGAKAFGFSVCQVRRNNATADHIAWQPDFVVSDLNQLLDRIQ
jgi:2-haloacid dehalogenase